MIHRTHFKISLLGEGMVGKTSLKNRVITGKFTDLYLTTLGVDFGVHNLIIDEPEAHYDVQLAIWDIAGQKNFATIRDGYFEGSNGAIIVFDVTRPETLIKIKDYWITPFYNKIKSNIPVLILENKIDLVKERNVSKKQIEDYLAIVKAELNLPADSLPYIEASVKEGTNVLNAIEEYTKTLIKIAEEKNRKSQIRI